MSDIGIELDRFDSAYDSEFYKRHGLGSGIFFDSAHYGVDRVVRFEVVDFSGYMPLAPSMLLVVADINCSLMGHKYLHIIPSVSYMKFSGLFFSLIQHLK